MRSRGRNAIFGTVICATALASMGQPGFAKELILVELRSIANNCEDAIKCIDESKLVLRNLLSFDGETKTGVVELFNRLAVTRDLPERAAAEPDPVSFIPMLVALKPSTKADALRGLKMVHFDSETLSKNESLLPFVLHVQDMLKELGIKELTKEEIAKVPGSATLNVRFSAQKESAGCITPFSVSFSVTEEVVMVRNPNVKLKTSIWSASSKENLANRNYKPFNALEDAVAKFVTDYRGANT
ncbi:MAG: hypothetical protein AAGK67_16295 [Pseudomonadota bacterium]